MSEATGRLRDIAAALRHEAAIAARPGQLDRLEAMASDLDVLAAGFDLGQTTPVGAHEARSSRG